MKIRPTNGMILCKRLPVRDSTGGIALAKIEEPARYEVVEDSAIEDRFMPGDILMCDSTGTSVKGEGLDLVLFERKAVVCKILEP